MIVRFTHESRGFFVARNDATLVIVWSQTRPIDPEIFAAHFDVAAEWALQHGPASLAVNYAGDFAPSARMRLALRDNSERMGLKALHGLVLLTNSAITRGALMATQLLGRPGVAFKGFATKDLERALHWLGAYGTLDREVIRGLVLEGCEMVNG